MSVVEFMSCGLVTLFGHQFLREGHQLECFSDIIAHRYPDLKLEAHQCGESTLRMCYQLAKKLTMHFTITNTKTRTQPINPYNFKTPLTDWLLDRSLFYKVHEILN